MNYINTQTMQLQTESEIRAANPNTSFPVPFMAPDGYAYVFPAPQPTYDPVTQRVQAATPEFTNLGHWEQRWEVVSAFTEYTDSEDVLHTVAEQEANAIAAHLSVIRASKVTAIKAERDRRKFNGVFVSDKWIHTDTYSRTQWLGMVLMGANVPAISWTTMDSTSITTSQALAGAVFQAAAQLDVTMHAYAKSLIEAVEASNDPASIDITTGWPATFEGVV